VVSSGRNFVLPTGIAIAANSQLFVAGPDCCGGNGAVIAVNPNQPPGNNQTVVSSGSYFGNPFGVAIAANGDLFVVDPAHGNAGVIRVNPNRPSGSNQTVVSSGGHFVSPFGIAIAANGDLWVVDPQCCGGVAGVIRVNPAGSNQPLGNNQTVVSFGGHLVLPVGIATAENGDLLVADQKCCGGRGGVIRVNPTTGLQTVWAQGDSLNFPSGIVIVPPRSILPPPASCGGSIPCACGNRVVRDRTLRGADPVTQTICPADGLVVAAGVTLDLGGATLRGQGAGVGVRIEPGATQVRVKRGKVVSFATGVRGEATTGVYVADVQVLDSVQDGLNLTGDHHTVEKVVIQDSGDLGAAVVGNAARLSRLEVEGNGRAGVRLVGHGHTLEQSVIDGNGEAGAEVSGDANQVARLSMDGNGGDGLFVGGTGNRVTRNTTTRNGRDGLEVHGASAVVERNHATSNGESGLEIHGTGHTVSSNTADLNTGTGLQVLETTGSRFDRNRSENNRGFGITDNSTGTRTSGTANTYTKNTCSRNQAGLSMPLGLCR